MATFQLQNRDIPVLEKLKTSGQAETIVKRARLLLLLHEGKTAAEISTVVGLAPGTINRWRRAYLNKGMDIFPLQEVPARSAPAAKKEKAAAPTSAKKAGKPSSTKASEKKRKRGKKKKKDELTVKLAKSVKAAIKVLASGQKGKLKQARKSKAFKKAREGVEKQKDAAFKLLKRIDKGKKAEGIKKQIEALDQRVKAMASVIKKHAGK